MFDWSKQVVLVTGASRGIGCEIAKHISSLGAKVALNYARNQEQAEKALQQCVPGNAKLYRADVGDEEQVAKMIEAIEGDFGSVTVLVNNAGQTRDNLLMMMSTEEWRSVMNTHLDGAFFCTRAVLRGMISNKRGRIINISSVSGLRGTAGQCNYSAAKAGLIGFTKALAREMGKKNITCNAVALGVIDTEMTQVLSPEVLKGYKEMIAMKRFGTTEEVAGVVEFLASNQADYINGQTIIMDGGII